MEASPVSRAVFARTKECVDISLDASFQACKPILDLRKEMASAIRKRELEVAIPSLKATLDALPRPAEPSAIEELAGQSWSWLLALGILVVATFGSAIFARVENAAPANDNAALRSTATDLDVPPPTGSDEPGKRRPELQLVPKVEPQRTPEAAVTRAQQIEAFVATFRAEFRRDPSFSETKAALGLPSATVSKYLSRALAA